MSLFLLHAGFGPPLMVNLMITLLIPSLVVIRYFLHYMHGSTYVVYILLHTSNNSGNFLTKYGKAVRGECESMFMYKIFNTKLEMAGFSMECYYFIIISFFLKIICELICLKFHIQEVQVIKS